MTVGLTSKQRWQFKDKSAKSMDNGWTDCPYCENTVHYVECEIDHIQPMNSGGSNRQKNLILVCYECNRSKYNIPLSVWLYLKNISPEAVYLRLKKAGKTIPDDMLDLLGYED